MATKRIVYEVTISEDQGNFKLNQAALPAEAKARIDEVVRQLKANPNGAYIEVEGYTDNIGEKAYNDQLGLERAESVKRYLYQEHQIPLHRINVISYGSDKPVAPNATRAGRALNRRRADQGAGVAELGLEPRREFRQRSAHELRARAPGSVVGMGQPAAAVMSARRTILQRLTTAVRW